MTTPTKEHPRRGWSRFPSRRLALCLLVLLNTRTLWAASVKRDVWADARRAPRGPNLFPNASFEVGYNQNWGHSTNLRNPGLLTQKDITDKVAHHGRYALQPTDSTLRRLDGLKGVVETFFTRPFLLEQGKVYSFGFYAFASRPSTEIRVEIGLPHVVRPDRSSYIPIHPKTTQTFRLSRKAWIRCEIFFHAPAKPAHLRWTVPKGVAFDAFFLQKVLVSGPSAAQSAEPAPGGEPDFLEELAGPRETPFTPTAPIEAGLFSDHPGHIFYREEGVRIPLRLANTSDSPRRFHLLYDIVNAQDKQIRQGKAGPFDLKPGEYRRETLDLGKHRMGKFSIVYYPEGLPQAKDELVYDVIQTPNGKSFCGAHTSALPEIGALFQRAGAPWYDTLTDGQFRWYYDWDPHKPPEPNLAAAPLVKQYGFKATLTILPNWFDYTRPNPNPLPLRHPNPIPDMDLWAKFCGTLARLYKPYMAGYMLGDELEAGYYPQEYLPILKTAVEAIRREQPDAKIAVSGTGPFIEGVFALGGDKYIDVIAGSTMGQGGDRGRRIGELARRYGKTVGYLAGFTRPVNFHRLHGGRRGAGGLYNKAVRSFFFARADGMTPYVARVQCLSTHTMMNPYNVILWDGSFTAAFTYFLIAGGILGGSEIDAEPLDAPNFHRGGLLWGFRRGGPDGRPGVAVAPIERTVTFSCPADKIEVRNWLDEPMELGAVGPGSCRVKLPPRYSYIYDNGLGRERFYETIRTARTDDPPPGEEAIRFWAWFERSGQELRRVAVIQGKGEAEARRIQPFTLEDLDGRPHLRVEKSRQTFHGRPAVPEQWGGYNPLGFWLTPAVRVENIKVDADLKEWLSRDRNDMYVTETVLSRYDRAWLHAWKDAFRITTDHGRDYRVYWWAGWSSKGLYFAARVNDDDFRPGPAGDRLALRVAGDWPPRVDLGTTESGVLKRPLSDPKTRKLALLTGEKGVLTVRNEADGKRLNTSGAWKRRPDPWGGWDVECLLPWTALGVEKAEAGRQIGFDLIGHDVDVVAGEPGEAALRWAARSRPLGQIVLEP